ncbi:MAG: hypothetical protein M1833_005261 [Piccolia ochrophora]|nr:MAG: hypothetical protein M1833_005261 [Piccolia ochrophora]
MAQSSKAHEVYAPMDNSPYRGALRLPAPTTMYQGLAKKFADQSTRPKVNPFLGGVAVINTENQKSVIKTIREQLDAQSRATENRAPRLPNAGRKNRVLTELERRLLQQTAFKSHSLLRPGAISSIPPDFKPRAETPPTDCICDPCWLTIGGYPAPKWPGPGGPMPEMYFLDVRERPRIRLGEEIRDETGDDNEPGERGDEGSVVHWNQASTPVNPIADQSSSHAKQVEGPSKAVNGVPRETIDTARIFPRMDQFNSDTRILAPVPVPANRLAALNRLTERATHELSPAEQSQTSPSNSGDVTMTDIINSPQRSSGTRRDRHMQKSLNSFGETQSDDNNGSSQEQQSSTGSDNAPPQSPSPKEDEDGTDGEPMDIQKETMRDGPRLCQARTTLNDTLAPALDVASPHILKAINATSVEAVHHDAHEPAKNQGQVSAMGSIGYNVPTGHYPTDVYPCPQVIITDDEDDENPPPLNVATERLLQQDFDLLFRQFETTPPREARDFLTQAIELGLGQKFGTFYRELEQHEVRER